MGISEEVRDKIIDLSQGNPGALTVLIQLFEQYGGEPIRWAEAVEGFRGPEIWLLFKDENGQDIDGFMMDLANDAVVSRLANNKYSRFYGVNTNE